MTLKLGANFMLCAMFFGAWAAYRHHFLIVFKRCCRGSFRFGNICRIASIILTRVHYFSAWVIQLLLHNSLQWNCSTLCRQKMEMMKLTEFSHMVTLSHDCSYVVVFYSTSCASFALQQQCCAMFFWGNLTLLLSCHVAHIVSFIGPWWYEFRWPDMSSGDAALSQLGPLLGLFAHNFITAL